MTPIFYEDLSIDQIFLSPGRTITEADLTIFAMVSGDWHPIHSNVEYARKSQFGQRIVHGPLGVAIVLGMFGRLGGFEDTAIALLDLREWKFVHPIFVGDTLNIEMRIASKRRTSDGQRGIVDREIKLIRQDGVAVQHGLTAMMIACRASEDLPR
jgi:acyl dehydratase